MTRARLPSDPCELLREVGPEPVPEGAFEHVALRLQGTLAGAASAETVTPSTPGSPRGLSGVLSPMVSLPLTFAVGALAGLVGFQEFRDGAGSAPSLVPSALVSAAPKLELPPPEPARVTLPPPSVPSAAAPAITAVSNLAQERSLLDRARAKMTAGEPSGALAVLALHERRHPRGVLSEEREAMAINALVSMGHEEEARRRGALFQARFPSSLVRRSVEAALANASAREAEVTDPRR